MMDILAATSSAPRSHDRGESGRNMGDTGFANLLGALGSKEPEAPKPASRRRPDDDLRETAAATEAPTAQAQPAAHAAGDAAEPPVEAGSGQSAGRGGGKDGDEANASGQPPAGEAGGPDGTMPGAATQQVASQAAATQAAGQPGASTTASTAASTAGTAADAVGTPASNSAASGPAAAAASIAPGAAASASVTQAAASAQAAATAFRIAQDGQPRAEVRLEAAAQGPRAALSGNTALAASLASSTDAAEPGATGLAGAPVGQKGTAGIADGTAAGTFASLAAEAAGQSSGDAAAGGRAQVLQGANDGDILLTSGTEAARAQAIQPGQAAAATTPANPAPPSQAPLADQVAVQMHRAVANGKDRLSIQLHPAELGRIDIKLELAQDGSVRAVLQAERKDTMDLLQRDVRGLERALQNAGLQTDGNSISFDLRGGQQQRSGQGFTSPFPTGEQGADAGLAESSEGPGQPGRTEARHEGAVNIRV